MMGVENWALAPVENGESYGVENWASLLSPTWFITFLFLIPMVLNTNETDASHRNRDEVLMK